jgi:hypothetical protein
LTGHKEFDNLNDPIHLIFKRLHRGGDMVKRRLQLVALLCCFLIGLSACSRKWAIIGGAVAAAGAGTYFYVKGDLKRNYEAPMDKTWQAAVQAVEELKLTTESAEHDAFAGVIKGKMADGKGVTINVKRLGENSTEVGVRIGTFGDRARSEAIHDKILSKL